MLMGEHAVLQGSHALVAATDQRLHVTLTPRLDSEICIQSALGTLSFTLAELATLEIKAPFTFVISVIKQFSERKHLPKLQQGFDLHIQSEFSSTVGLGSSAAVLVATTLALLHFTRPASTPVSEIVPEIAQEQVFKLAYHSLRQVQGCGSGADLAASILGGIVYYRQTPFFWQKLEVIFPITLAYSGYKTPTPEVIRRLESARQQDPDKFALLFSAIDHACILAAEALKQHDLAAFSTAFQTNQTLMQALGVVDSALQNMVDLFKPLTAKVSGSGLGDCVIGLGNTSRLGEYAIIPAQLSIQGARVHED